MPDSSELLLPPPSPSPSRRTPQQATPLSLAPGDRIDKFEVRRRLGQGGMGAVYLAHDPVIDREVAIKILSRDIATDAAAMKRFLGEARAAGQLSHPHVVAVYGVDAHAGEYFIVMEYVRGGSVADLLARQTKLDALRATDIVAQACAGLGAAHALGLVHRDVKPANLMLDETGTVKVADFGLARSQQSASAGLTQSGYIVGTPFFMSPEQCTGNAVDARSDVYSLGATYYTLLAGESPYEHAGSTMQIILSHVHDPVPDPKKILPDLPPACGRIISRAMSKLAEERYQSADLMFEDLEAVAALLRDKGSSQVIRYRGSVVNPRETLVLPSEKIGSGGASKTSLRKPSGTSWRPPTLSGSVPVPAPAETAPKREEPPVKSGSTEVLRRAGAGPEVPAPVPPDRSRELPLVGARQDVYALGSGPVAILWPEQITPEEAAELDAWLDLIKRKVKRLAAGPAEKPPAVEPGKTDKPA
jgi:serine/threonine protein kinase